MLAERPNWQLTIVHVRSNDASEVQAALSPPLADSLLIHKSPKSQARSASSSVGPRGATTSSARLSISSSRAKQMR
jgi:hypothetical protein